MLKGKCKCANCETIITGITIKTKDGLKVCSNWCKDDLDTTLSNK